MKAHIKERLILIVLAAVALASCKERRTDKHTETRGLDEGPERATAEPHRAESDHDDNDHGENEVSDLDRPVAELFAVTCEHNLKTHECDECRHEVGVVKTDASLFDGGLLKKTKAEKRAVAAPLKLTGVVRFDERRVAHVSTQAEGIIKAVFVTLGDRVKRRQALVEIESVAIGEAQATYLEAAGMLALAKRNHARLEALRKEGISSEKELLSARQGRDAAQIRTDAAFGKLKRLGMSTSAARGLTQKTATGRLVLRAPVAGTVLDIHAVAGVVARADKSLATVGDNASVWVWADLYERDIALVMREQARRPLSATVGVKAFPEEEFAGTVDFVSPSMNESSRTVKARINVPNPRGRLLTGMFAQVKVFIPGDQQVLALPGEAVLADEGRAFVFVHHEGDYWVRRPVTPGRTFAGMTEIKKGLTGSEVVVANGAFLLKSDVLRSKMGAGCAD
jgi:cobalt-zinc-cadmium efflux system membrane fusion protein